MKSSTICQDWLNSIPLTQGYLKKEQTIGRDFLLENGMPSNKDEAWRLSNINKLNSFLTLPTTILSLLEGKYNGLCWFIRSCIFRF